MEEIIGVVMAAGMGKRLKPLTDTVPKALIKVGGKELLGHAVDFLRFFGCNGLAVVAGYRNEQVSAYIAELHPDAIIINNPDYDKQNAISFRLALNHIKGNLLFSDVDFVRPLDSVPRYTGSFGEVTYFVTRDYLQDADCMRVKISHDGFLLDLSKGMEAYDAISAGMLFVPDGYRGQLSEAASSVIAQMGPENARLEDAMRQAVRAGLKIKIKDVGKADWSEIDTPEELEQAEKILQD